MVKTKRSEFEKLTLNTKRCRVKILGLSDFEESFRLFTDEHVRKYLGGRLSKEDSIKKLQTWICEEESLYLSVRIKKTKQFIGIISLTPYYETDHYEISYQFLYDVWGQGYAREVLDVFLDYCISELELTKVIAETQCANKNSRRLLEKLGFKLESQLERFGEEQCCYAYNFDGNKGE